MTTPDPRMSVPEKHFPKWLEKESRLAELKIWLEFARYVLALGTIVGLTIFVGNKFPEALKTFPPIVVGIWSLAGVAIGIDKYRKRKQHDDQ
jgi:hypothetical protein